MSENKDIWALTGDLGFGGFDKIREDFPDRFINCGASEQAMMGMAVGLAQEGKIPFVYSITPFLLFRPFETIRNYLHHEKAHVILIGSGRYTEYEHDGFSHDATDDTNLHNLNIDKYRPTSLYELHSAVDDSISSNKASFISLSKKDFDYYEKRRKELGISLAATGEWLD